IGAIYLPQDLTEFQKNWLLAREWSLKKRIWHLCTMREYGIENYNDVDFKTVKKEIKRKRLKRN
ncbi:MAG: hypothetical protein PUB18_04195, partial [bacterium]|nr:hypothetical protein [bacterium]